MRLRPSSLALVLVPLLAVAAAHAGGGNVLTGQPAPELTLADGLNGASAQTTFSSLRGKVVCLKFWLTGCPVCRGTLPEFQRIHERYGRSGVVCLGVVIDSAAGVRPYLKEAGWTFPVGCDPDGRNASRYGVHGYPADYVVGVDGVVRASNGFDRDVIEQELRKVRVLELGAVPPSMVGAREAVEDGDYGEGLRRAETAAKTDTGADARAFVERLTALARQRQDNRFARADGLVAAGRVVEAKAELERVLTDFQGTSLEARARERLQAASK